MNKYVLIQKVFGDIKPLSSEEEDAMFTHACKVEQSPFIHDCIKELERLGHQFGYGIDCYPDCTC